MSDEELTDEELVKALRDTYDLVKMWPEKRPDGFTNLLVLRNLVPDTADRIEALTAELTLAEQRGYANAMEAERKLQEDRIEELEWLRDALVKKAQGLTNLLDDQFGTPCEQIRHKQEIEALTEQLEAARADAKEAEAYAEELGQQCEGLMQAGMNNGQALIIAEAKLAEAVEALKAIKLYSGCGDSRRQAITTLAEIEGEKG
jgi:hypothetical protein